MEPDHPELPQATVPKSTLARIFIACLRCKVRKTRCDGLTPSCSNCVATGVECMYAPGRRYRGPAKKRIKPHAVKRLNGTPKEQTTEAKAFLLKLPAHLRSRVQRLKFIDYLLVYGEHLQAWRSRAKGRGAGSTRIFAPLMPLEVAVALMDNSAIEVVGSHQLLEQAEFMKLLEAQYEASSTEPAGGFARWAIVNTLVAFAVRTRITAGSETKLSNIADTLYRNATIVLMELILQEPCKLSVQALLVMAIFANGIPDARACTMLATNASRLLDLVRSSDPAWNPQQNAQLCAIASALGSVCA